MTGKESTSEAGKKNADETITGIIRTDQRDQQTGRRVNQHAVMSTVLLVGPWNYTLLIVKTSGHGKCSPVTY